MKVPFVNLKDQYFSLKAEIDNAMVDVCENTEFILGRHVEKFENQFAEFCNAKYAVGVNSGTAALHLALLSYGIKEGDEVITAPNSFFATAEAISLVGAKPVFVDINETTFNIDWTKVEAAITERTKAIMPVHLYGQTAEMDKLLELAEKYNLTVIEDACQAHGAKFKDRIVPFGETACFSFYPTKNLGCFGEGGAVVTNNYLVAEKIKSLRAHGESPKNSHSVVGYNYRLAGIQGAILAVKLKSLSGWNDDRRRIANLYHKLLDGHVITPSELNHHVYHLYIIKDLERDRLKEFLDKKGISTGIHYPVPIHLQPAYKHLGYNLGDFPVAEKVATEILSLPMFPSMTDEEIHYVADAIKEFKRENQNYNTTENIGNTEDIRNMGYKESQENLEKEIKLKALVTGGAGLIGSHIVDLLLEKGYKVRIFDNLEPETHSQKPEWVPEGVEFLNGDMQDRNAVERALEGVDLVFHQAAYGGFAPEISKYVKSNSLGTAYIFDIIKQKKLPIKKIVIASSQAVYGEGKYNCPTHGAVCPPVRPLAQFVKKEWEVKCPICECDLKPMPTDEETLIDPGFIYSITKYSQERMAIKIGEALGIPTVALRYSMTYGPRQSLVNPYTGVCSIFSTRILNDLPPIIYEDGQQTRDLVYVKDVAKANIFVAENEEANYNVYNIGTGVQTKMIDFAKLLIELYGKDFEPQLNGEFRPGEVRHIFCDNSKLAKLGFKPTVTVRQGLLNYIEWIKKQGNVEEYFSKAFDQMKAKGIVRSTE